MNDNDAQLQAIKARRSSRERRAEAIILANTGLNAGTAIMPLGTSVVAFIVANTTMVGFVGKIYGYEFTNAQSGRLIRQIMISIGTTWSLGVFAMKLGVEVAKVTGLATFGATTAVACTVDAVLSGCLSYALGYTAMAYFQNNCQLDRKQMRLIMLTKFEERWRQSRSKSPARRTGNPAPADDGEPTPRQSRNLRTRSRVPVGTDREAPSVRAPTDDSTDDSDAMARLFASFKPEDSE